jgi:hypothetical protein
VLASAAESTRASGASVTLDDAGDSSGEPIPVAIETSRGLLVA